MTVAETSFSTSGLVPREHVIGPGAIPYFDEVLQVPQSKAHQRMIYTIGPVLESIAGDAGLLFLSDHPIWYLDPDSGKQKTYYGDLVLAASDDPTRITADSLVAVIEVVSLSDKRKEKKDVVFQRALNLYNEVPEFGLLFPDAADARSLIWCRLDNGSYHEEIIAPGGRVTSHSVPDLELRVLPKEQWQDGHKIAVYYRGEHRPTHDQERSGRLEAEIWANQERERAEREEAGRVQAESQAEQERAGRVEAESQAEQERQRAEQERAGRVEAESQAEQERERSERLARRLRELGLDPEG